jgi:hypothetical protein
MKKSMGLIAAHCIKEPKYKSFIGSFERLVL